MRLRSRKRRRQNAANGAAMANAMDTILLTGPEGSYILRAIRPRPTHSRKLYHIEAIIAAMDLLREDWPTFTEPTCPVLWVAHIWDGEAEEPTEADLRRKVPNWATGTPWPIRLRVRIGANDLPSEALWQLYFMAKRNQIA